MASNSRPKVKGRRISKPFGAVPVDVLDSDIYASLSFKAVKLLLDLAGQYRGKNNGDLTVAYKVMKPKGWTSKGTLQLARDELLEKGLIMITRQGGRNLTQLYALTFWPIDDCKGKLDVSPTTKAPHTWKQIKLTAPKSRATCPEIRSNGPGNVAHF